MNAEQARFDEIMRNEMKNRTAKARGSVGLDAERPGILTMNPYANNGVLAAHDKKAGKRVRWQDTKIQSIPDSVGCDPWAMVRDADRNPNSFRWPEPEAETGEADDPKVQTLLDEINNIMGRGTRRKSLRRSSANDSGKCSECRLSDSGQRIDRSTGVRTEIENAIARLQTKLAEF